MMISKPKSFQTDTEKELLHLTITLSKGYVYQLEILGFYFAGTVADSFWGLCLANNYQTWNLSSNAAKIEWKWIES